MKIEISKPLPVSEATLSLGLGEVTCYSLALKPLPKEYKTGLHAICRLMMGYFSKRDDEMEGGRGEPGGGEEGL